MTLGSALWFWPCIDERGAVTGGEAATLGTAQPTEFGFNAQGALGR
jgi:hypothetical protein